MSRTPLLEGWDEYRKAPPTAWTTPGHKGRRDLVGDVVRDDVPLYGGVDTVRERYHRLADANELLAQAWGADWARISVSGSTHGNQSLCLAVASPGDKVIVNRNLHRSQLIGLVLADLVPVWVQPTVDPRFGLPTKIPVEVLTKALDENDVRAVMLVEPSYVGTVSDVAALVRAAHAHDCPVVVDQAWGAHFGFHQQLPPHALQVDADALVTSAHKTLPAYTQAAFVMARTQRLDASRLSRSFDALGTTSPSGTIVASADAARAFLVDHGQECIEEVIALTADVRAQIAQIAGLAVLESSDDITVDPLKVVISLAGAGVNGLALEDALVDSGHPVEMANRNTLIPLFTLADTREKAEEFVSVLRRHVKDLRGEPREVLPAVAWSVQPDVVMPPREAFFAQHRVVSADAAIGRVSAELVAPYPPGIPVLAPGERISREAVEGLQRVMRAGTQVRYAADPTLATFQVVA